MNQSTSVPIYVVIPALNEAASLPHVVSRLRAAEPQRIVVVDNGSTDDTAAVSRSAGAVVVSEPERGYGAACLAGLKHLADAPRNGIVAFFDGDGADDPGLLPTLVQPIARGRADMVLASRTLESGERGALTAAQRWGNRVACRAIRWRWGHTYTDLAPCRALRLSALDRLAMTDRDYGWTVEMQIRALRCNLRIEEIPSRYRRRREGRSKISGSVGASIRAGVTILRVVGREAWRPRCEPVSVTSAH